MNDHSNTSVEAAKALLITLLCLRCAAGSGAGQVPIFLGVIEPTPQDYVATGPTPSFMVRAAFQWKNGTWGAFPCEISTPEGLRNATAEFPERVSWTIAFDGRDLGEFKTTRPSEWKFYGEIGLLQPNPGEHVNLIRHGARDFVYWDNYPLPFRPLVVVSRPYFADPDRWKPENTPSDVVERVVPSFRKAVPSAQLSCGGEPTKQYSDQLIRRRQSFVSAAGVRLVQLGLDDSAVRNCGELRGNAFASRWFYVDSTSIRPLGQSLELIDAGDYDNDGHSEVMFHKSGYNYDGYVLLYDRLQREATFDWNYH
jgi:hypothetical protein